jgi:hypothetical protein
VLSRCRLSREPNERSVHMMWTVPHLTPTGVVADFERQNFRTGTGA